MTEWYRRKTWTKTDEEEFFAKLRRAWKDSRAQYLKIQAITLIGTKKKHCLSAAETLLNKVLNDFPENRVEKSQTYLSLGRIYELNGDDTKALEFYKKSMDFEKGFPNVQTGSYLSYAETAIRTRRTDLYPAIELRLLSEINAGGLQFPYSNYLTYSFLAVIAAHDGKITQARRYADLAETNATAISNTLWNPRKRKFGIVDRRIDWLDKLVKKASS